MRLLTLLLFSISIAPTTLHAHASEQGFVLLLPTTGYVIGGTASVALTVLLLALAPRTRIENLFRCIRIRFAVPRQIFVATQTIALIGFLLAIGFGFIGATDPLRNPLTLLVWTVFWIALVSIQGAVFDIWRYLNPFAATARLGRDAGWHPQLRLPNWGYWPALCTFLAFAGFLLADPAPADPCHLAKIILAYLIATTLGLCLFGGRWLVRVEAMTVLMRLYRQTAPISARRIGVSGWRITKAATPSVALALFILVLLGSGSFDGLNETFWWLQKLGVNPLEFPGRSAVVVQTLAGLAAANAILILAYGFSIWAGIQLTQSKAGFVASFCTFAPSVLPIAVAYHIAHYLTTFMVDWQYVRSLLLSIVGGDAIPVTTGFFNTLGTVKIIWLTQAGVVVIGHVIAILVAHTLAMRFYRNHRQATLSQLPLAGFMILYTLFGLWLLASPRG